MTDDTLDNSDLRDRKINESTGNEILPNVERGCGHLQPGGMYLRSDLHPQGQLPCFVELEEPIKYNEDQFRGYKEINGLAFERAMELDTVPEGELEDHWERLEDSEEVTHFGDMKTPFTRDIIMFVGKKYYNEPEAFIREAKTQGVNKRIPMSKGREPPVVNPGKTRLWFIHPKAVKVEKEDSDEDKEDEEYRAGVFGYTYLTRAFYFTENDSPDDNNDPAYVEKWAKTRDDLDIVEAGEEIEAEEDEREETLEEYMGGEE